MTSNLKSICDPTSEIVDVTIYRKKIGSLIYSKNMRLNICFAEPRFVHMVVKKHMVWYLKGTIEYGLIYVRDQRIFLRGYDDSNWVDSTTNIKSTLTCCRKRTIVSLSTTKD